MDLVTGLALVNGFNTVCTVIDRFSKEIMVFPTTNTISAPQLALLFRNHVWCRHGTPVSIIVGNPNRRQFEGTRSEPSESILLATARKAMQAKVNWV